MSSAALFGFLPSAQVNDNPLLKIGSYFQSLPVSYRKYIEVKARCSAKVNQHKLVCFSGQTLIYTTGRSGPFPLKYLILGEL